MPDTIELVEGSTLHAEGEGWKIVYVPPDHPKGDHGRFSLLMEMFAVSVHYNPWSSTWLGPLLPVEGRRWPAPEGTKVDPRVFQWVVEHREAITLQRLQERDVERKLGDAGIYGAPLGADLLELLQRAWDHDPKLRALLAARSANGPPKKRGAVRRGGGL